MSTLWRPNGGVGRGVGADLPAVTIEGEVYRQVVRCEESYVSAAGPDAGDAEFVSARGEGERTLCPLELRAGIVEGRWTPLAARQAAFVVAHLTAAGRGGFVAGIGDRDYMDVMLWGGTG